MFRLLESGLNIPAGNARPSPLDVIYGSDDRFGFVCFAGNFLNNCLDEMWGLNFSPLFI